MRREYDFSGGKRGPVLPVPPGKTRITIRIDNEILDWFRRQVHLSGGGNYQSLMNEALRDHVHRKQEDLETTFRRVLREEIPAAGYRVKGRRPQAAARGRPGVKRNRN